MNGNDYTLYLVFLRYSAYLCLIITLMNLGLMIPIYASGDPMPDDNYLEQNQSSMNRFTILNITASHNKFDFIYGFTMLGISVLVYALVILMKFKYERYKKKVDPHMDDFDDMNIARYSLFVRGLP
jgi:hypothetical protein